MEQNKRGTKHFARQWMSMAAAAGLFFSGAGAFAMDDDSGKIMLAQATQQERQQTQARQQTQTGDVSGLRTDLQDIKKAAAVKGFNDFVALHQSEDKWKEEPEKYTLRGLRHMTVSLGEIIPEGDSQLQAQFSQLHQQVAKLDNTIMPQHQGGGPQEGQQAQQAQPEPGKAVQDVLNNSARILSSLQQRYYPNYAQQVRGLSQSVQKIEGDSISDQAEQINNFFVDAGMTLEGMAFVPGEMVGGGPEEGQDTQMQPDEDVRIEESEKQKESDE